MRFSQASHPEVPRMPVTSKGGRAILTTLLRSDGASRVELAARLGLSQPAVTRSTRTLLQAGYLAETEAIPTPGGRGRPTSLLTVVPERLGLLGVKVTASEVIGAGVDLAGEIRATVRAPLASTEPEQVVAAIAKVAGDLREDMGIGPVAALGVGVTGDVDSASGTARHAPLMGWAGIPLGRMVAEASGLPTVVDNDVRALTRGEWWYGAGRGAGSFALVTVGAGVGCGLFLNGSIYEGAHGVTGELGHLPLDARGLRCACGATGCVETAASTAAILRDLRAIDGLAEVTIAQAAGLAADGNRAVLEVFERVGVVLGRALACVANLVGPERIILSGEGMAQADLYGERLHQVMSAHAFGAAICEIVIKPLPFEQWARAAAVSALETFVTGGTPRGRADAAP
jgi:predicted NBD/HSP70 family sugar kinase